MTAKPLAGARILLIIGGGVAAYKSLELIRRLRERAAVVRVVMTEAAKQFITPLSAAALSGHAVRFDQFSLIDEAEMDHIELSRAADLVVVAPATADLLARMAHGLANDLASTTLLATDKRVIAAPAMNIRMWLHPATRRNVAALSADGVAFVGPDNGEMACGEFGPGRMAEPLAIVAAIERALGEPTAIPLPPASAREAKARPARSRASAVVVTSGPTYEPIDPVRFLGNRSSGLQGHAIAEAALSRRRESDVDQRPRRPCRSLRRRSRPRRDGAANARRRLGAPARRRVRRGGGGRRLARRDGRRAEAQEGRRRRAGPVADREPRHPRGRRRRKARPPDFGRWVRRGNRTSRRKRAE